MRKLAGTIPAKLAITVLSGRKWNDEGRGSTGEKRSDPSA